MTGDEEGTSHTLTLLSSFLVLLPAFPHSQHIPLPAIPNSPVCVCTYWEGAVEGCGTDFTVPLVPSKLSPTPFSFVALPLPLRGPHNEEGRSV